MNNMLNQKLQHFLYPHKNNPCLSHHLTERLSLLEFPLFSFSLSVQSPFRAYSLVHKCNLVCLQF